MAEMKKRSMRKLSASKATAPKTEYPDDHQFRCVHCSAVYETPTNKFFKVNNSPLWQSNYGFCPICQTCLNNMFEHEVARYGASTAMMLACHRLDAPFDHGTFEKMNENTKNLTIGAYVRALNAPSLKTKNFDITLINKEFSKDFSEVREERETKWTKQDIQNRKSIFSAVGYDPFEDSIYTDADRKFLFNTLANYISDEDVEKDPHRLQSAINLALTFLQKSKVDLLIGEEQSKPNQNLETLKTLTDIRKNFDSNINALANDNGFSSKNNSRGTNKKGTALTEIMKKMIDDNFEPAKVNFIDVRTSKILYSVADVCNRNLFDQLNYQEDDYARMVAKQRDIIQKYDNRTLNLEEENRKLRILLESNGISADSIENAEDIDIDEITEESFKDKD